MLSGRGKPAHLLRITLTSEVHMKQSVNIRLPEELHREVKAVAAKAGVSMSEYIEAAVVARIKKHKKRKGLS